MLPIDLSNKTAVVFGVANHRSIAWHIAQTLHRAGAELFIVYQNERLRESVQKLVAEIPRVHLVECDVSTDENVARAFEQISKETPSVHAVVHSIAFANREDLSGDFSRTGRDGFRVALDISAYSLIPIARYAAPLMANGGGSILALTFQASERVFPGYNIMGVAKAALENEVRQLAYELGAKGIRVNAVSPGPLDTLSSRAIHGYVEMKRVHAERSPLRRNITHEEVANTALFLLSDLSSGITGTIIPIDGGYHIAGV